MRGLICSLLVLLAANSGAEPLSNPSILFTHAFESQSGRREVGFDVLTLPEGDAIISGSSSPEGSGPDGLLMRVNSQGEIRWRKTFGGAGLDLIFSCLPDERNGFVCVGLKSPTGQPGLKAMDGWILRIDSEGNLTWEQTYGGTGEDRLTGIRKTTDGYMAVGHRETDGKIQAWVLRTDLQGKELNSWTYASEKPTKGLDVLPQNDGGFVFVGGEGEQRETSDGFAIRVNAGGKMVWKRAIGGPEFQVGYHLQRFQDGSFLVIGYGATESNTDHQAYVMKITEEGRVLYHKSFGGPTHDRATNALILENDRLIVVGQTQRPGAPDEDSGWDLVVYAIDREGSPLWSGRYGGEGVEFGRSVKGQAANLWIIGHTTSERSGSNVLLIRMDASVLL